MAKKLRNIEPINTVIDKYTGETYPMESMDDEERIRRVTEGLHEGYIKIGYRPADMSKLSTTQVAP